MNQLNWDDVKAIISWIVKATGFFADLLTILASLVAIYVFWMNRSEIGQVLKQIAGWRVHASTHEVQHKINKLSELDSEKNLSESKILLSQLIGQLNGVPEFSPELNDLLMELRKLARGKTVPNAKKQELLSELTERLRNIQLNMHKKERQKK